MSISLRELDKGSSFRFVDQAPRSARRKGQPTRISAGDELLFSNPIVDAAGARAGSLRAVCTAPISSGFARASFNCIGVYRLAAGDIWVTATTGRSSTTAGAIVGGTRASRLANRGTAGESLTSRAEHRQPEPFGQRQARVALHRARPALRGRIGRRDAPRPAAALGALQRLT